MKHLRSDITKLGLTRTPHRAFMRAMGLAHEDNAKPMIGIVSMKGEADAVQHDARVSGRRGEGGGGEAAAGGTPREFATISMSDGIG